MAEEIFNVDGSTTGTEKIHDIVVTWGGIGSAYKVNDDYQKTLTIADITDKYSKAIS